MLDLSQFSTIELRREIARRVELSNKGCCDRCGKALPVCLCRGERQAVPAIREATYLSGRPLGPEELERLERLRPVNADIPFPAAEAVTAIREDTDTNGGRMIWSHITGQYYPITEVCGGRLVWDHTLSETSPAINGTKIIVARIAAMIEDGKSEDTILAWNPELTNDDIRAALAYTANPGFRPGPTADDLGQINGGD
jgi:hypothetical protein